jgi:hypothetical protein
MREERVLLHLDERTRRALDPADVQPQVNLVLPVARGELPALWRAFGERE